MVERFSSDRWQRHFENFLRNLNSVDDIAPTKRKFACPKCGQTYHGKSVDDNGDTHFVCNNGHFWIVSNIPINLPNEEK